MTATLDLAPDEARYGVKFGAAARRLETDGSRGRHRLDQLGAPCEVNISWEATRVEYDYLTAFYRTNLAAGVVPFFIDLIIDGPMAQQTARFEPGSMKLAGQSGDDLYLATAKLEVMPPARDAGADAALVASYAAAVDGTPVMALTPGSGNYSADRGEEIIQSAADMGPTLIRAGFASSPATMSISWGVNAARLQYLAAFYFTAIREGALPFIVPLVLQTGAAVDHVALLVPGSFEISGVDGNVHLVSATIVTEPLPRDATADSETIAAFPDAP